MSGDASVNIGVAHWPGPDSAWWAVRRMQIKLHRWASEDFARRFDDLYNLVCDPAFLVHAFERVVTNVGARTPGVHRVTVAWIRSQVGVEVFLDAVHAQLRTRVRPDAGAAGDDS